ncbi:hypothetical protein F5146DRAFT_1009581 [Armillaria mellea]|nr:hypothetical protein F5146DRAFT_1009581 [Armillaria mellea]
MGGGIIDMSVGREIGMPHIIYHIPHGRRFGDVMNGPLKKIGYRVKGDVLIMAFNLENQREISNLSDGDINGALYFHTDSILSFRLHILADGTWGLGMVIIEACEVNRTSEEHSEKDREKSSFGLFIMESIVHEHGWSLFHSFAQQGHTILRMMWMWIIGYPINEAPEASRFGHMQNVSLKAIGVQAEGDLLMMKLDGCSDCEVGHLLDVIDAITHLMRNRIVMVVAMEDSVVSRSLNTIVQSYYQGSHDAIAHLIYEQNTSLCEEYAGTSVYVDQKENTVLRGSLLGRLHFGMCLMGEIVVSRGIISRGASSRSQVS